MKKLIELIPLISGILIFIGFLNYSFFYNQFGIEISSYLTTGELILSFLRLTISLVIILGILSVYFIAGIAGIIIVNIGDQDESDAANQDLFINEVIRNVINNIKERTYKSVGDYLWTILDLISILISVIGHLFIIGYLFFVYNQVISSEPYLLSGNLTIVVGIIWYFYLSIFFKKLGTRRNHNYKIIQYVLLSIITLSIIYISNKEKAMYIINGTPEYEVTLYMQSDTISTDSTLYFIGKTKDYCFLRVKSDSSNIIFSTEEIRRFDFYKRE